jgi:hypothetical protein
MRPSEYLLNPEKLQDLIGYILVIILTIGIFFFQAFFFSKERILIKQRTER